MEILRLWPPFLGAYRVTNTDIEVGDFHVPKGYVNTILVINKLHNMYHYTYNITYNANYQLHML